MFFLLFHPHIYFIGAGAGVSSSLLYLSLIIDWISQIVSDSVDGCLALLKLFILCINDVWKVSNILKMEVFADDTNILCSGEISSSCY